MTKPSDATSAEPVADSEGVRFQLQAKGEDGTWTNIFPAQLNLLSKHWEVRAVETATPPSSGNADAMRAALTEWVSVRQDLNGMALLGKEKDESDEHRKVREAKWTRLGNAESALMKAALSSAPVAGEWQEPLNSLDYGLSDADQKAQGKRCGCGGVDDYCVCQNVPDTVTWAERRSHALPVNDRDTPK